MSADILNRLRAICRDIENITESPSSRDVLSEAYDVINRVQNYLRDALDIDMAGKEDSLNSENISTDSEEDGHVGDDHAQESNAEDANAEDSNAEDGNTEDVNAEDGPAQDNHMEDGSTVGDPVGDGQPSKKDGQERYEDMMRSASKEPMSVSSLLQLILYGRRGSWKTKEQDAFRRLVSGYHTASEQSLTRALGVYSSFNGSWDSICDESSKKDAIADCVERMLSRDEYLASVSQTDNIMGYVHYVVRTVHTIKFADEWQERAGTVAGRHWKHNYLERLFQHLESDEINRIQLSRPDSERDQKLKKLRKRFKDKYEKVIASRNHVLKLYTIFGAGVLLDPLWGTSPQLSATPRSRTFGQTLVYFLEHVQEDLSRPTSGDGSPENETHDDVAGHRSSSYDIVLRVIKLLAGEKLTVWVREFLDHGDVDDHHFSEPAPLLLNKGKGRAIDPVMDEGPQPGPSRLGKRTRSTESVEGERSARPPKRRRCDQASSSRRDKKRVVISRDESGEDSVTMSDVEQADGGDDEELSGLPTHCPECSDLIPRPIGQRLASLLGKRLGMVDGSREMFHHDIQICIEIKTDQRRRTSQAYGTKKHWPTTIDFAQLGLRVVKMYQDLVALLQYHDVLDASVVWKVFRKENSNLVSFVRNLDAQAANMEKARPGYYGEKGSVIIQKMLLEFFARVDHTCIHIKPLTLHQFSQHILVPYVATRLIAEDKKCSVDAAFGIMRESAEYGCYQFSDTDDDEEYEAVQQTCMRLARECTNYA